MWRLRPWKFVSLSSGLPTLLSLKKFLGIISGNLGPCFKSLLAEVESEGSYKVGFFCSSCKENLTKAYLKLLFSAIQPVLNQVCFIITISVFWTQFLFWMLWYLILCYLSSSLALCNKTAVELVYCNKHFGQSTNLSCESAIFLCENSYHIISKKIIWGSLSIFPHLIQCYCALSRQECKVGH